MAKVIQDSRILIKASTVVGVEPEVAPSTDHTDGTWSAADVYTRELMANVADGKIWMRMNSGIKEILVMPSGATTGDIFMVSGNTFVRIAAGASGYVLTANGVGLAPTYQPSSGGGGGGSSTLTNTHIFVGNASNVATDVAMSGDTTIDNLGAVTIANNAVTYPKSYNGLQLAVVNTFRTMYNY